MQPSGREIAGGEGGPQQADDFFDQMLSTLPSAWADLGAGGNKSPWELAAGAEDAAVQAAFGDESALLASRLRQHQIGGGDVKSSSSSPVMLQLSDLHRHGGGLAGGGAKESGGFSPLPLFTDRSAPAPEEMEGGFKSPNSAVSVASWTHNYASFLLGSIFPKPFARLVAMDSACPRASSREVTTRCSTGSGCTARPPCSHNLAREDQCRPRAWEDRRRAAARHHPLAAQLRRPAAVRHRRGSFGGSGSRSG
uniref:Uncharacterized protein n=1 Tax=Setaria italica TaxID=4555 RepID=K3Y1U5_SETIT